MLIYYYMFKDSQALHRITVVCPLTDDRLTAILHRFKNSQVHLLTSPRQLLPTDQNLVTTSHWASPVRRKLSYSKSTPRLEIVQPLDAPPPSSNRHKDLVFRRFVIPPFKGVEYPAHPATSHIPVEPDSDADNDFGSQPKDQPPKLDILQNTLAERQQEDGEKGTLNIGQKELLVKEQSEHKEQSEGEMKSSGGKKVQFESGERSEDSPVEYSIEEQFQPAQCQSGQQRQAIILYEMPESDSERLRQQYKSHNIMIADSQDNITLMLQNVPSALLIASSEKSIPSPEGYTTSWQEQNGQKGLKVAVLTRDSENGEVDGKSEAASYRTARRILYTIKESTYIAESQVENKLFIKRQQRCQCSRRRVILAGLSQANTQRIKEKLDIYGDQVLIRQVERNQEKTEGWLNEYSCLLVYDEQGVNNAVGMGILLKTEQPVKIFIITQTPHKLARMFWDSDKIVFMGTSMDHAVIQIGHYIGPQVTENHIILQERKKTSARFKLFFHQSLAAQFQMFIQNKNGALVARPFSSLQSLKLIQEGKLPSVLINRESDRSKLSLLPWPHCPRVQVIQLCKFPSENKELLARYPHIFMLCDCLNTIQMHIASMLSNKHEIGLLKRADYQFYGLKVCVLIKNRNPVLLQLHERFEDEYPLLRVSLITKIDEIPDGPVFVVTDDRTHQCLTDQTVLRKQLFIMIYSHGPSLFKPLYDSHPRVLAISHRTEQLVKYIRAFIKPEQSFSKASQQVCCLDIYLIGQCFQQKQIWLETASHHRNIAIKILQTAEHLKNVDLYSRPVLLVASDLCEFRVRQLIALNSDNSRLYVFIHTVTPSKYLNTQVLAASNQPDFLQAQLPQLISDVVSPFQQALTRTTNRQSYRRIKLLWLDDGTRDSEESCRSFFAEFRQNLTISLFKDFAKVQEQFDLPAMVCLPVQYIRDAVQFYYNNQQRSLFFFIKGQYPQHSTSLFQKYQKISKIANTYKSLIDQMRHFIMPDKRRLPFFKESPRTQARVRLISTARLNSANTR